MLWYIVFLFDSYAYVFSIKKNKVNNKLIIDLFLIKWYAQTFWQNPVLYEKQNQDITFLSLR